MVGTLPPPVGTLPPLFCTLPPPFCTLLPLVGSRPQVSLRRPRLVGPRDVDRICTPASRRVCLQSHALQVDIRSGSGTSPHAGSFRIEPEPGRKIPVILRMVVVSRP